MAAATVATAAPGAAPPAAAPAGNAGGGGGGGGNNVVGAVAVGVGTVAGVVGGVAAAGAKMLLGAVANKNNSGDKARPAAASGRAATAAQAQAARLLDEGAARRYSWDELSRATGGFSPANLIGRGGYGCVYRGTLDGVPVAEIGRASCRERV